MNVMVVFLHSMLSMIHARPQGMDVVRDRKLIASIHVQGFMRQDILIILNEFMS